MKRICQFCGKWYDVTPEQATITRYCGYACRTASAQRKFKARLGRLHTPQTLEERRKELDDILGTDE